MRFLLKFFSLISLIALTACGAKDSSQQAVKAAKEEMKTATEAAATNAAKMKEAAMDSKAALSEAVTDASSKVADKMSDAKDKMSDVKDKMSDAKDKMSAAKDIEVAKTPAAKKAMADKKVAVKELSSSKKQAVEKTTAKAKEKMADAKEAVKSTATTVKEKANVNTGGVKKVAAAAAAAATTAATTVKNKASKVAEKATEKVAPAKKEVAKKVNATVDHGAWDQILRKNVSSTGKVNYKGIKANKAALEGYVKALDVPFNNSWSRSEKMAYWINAYNAFTVKLIVDNYPVKSNTDLDGGKPWDKSWIKLGGKTYSLNDIEHKILRPQFKDARIHFAVNCAASSCPPLLNKAWTAKNLNSNFERQTKSFINNAKYNSIASDKLAVSKIFDWYKEDFGDLVTYLNKYAGTKINAGTNVGFKEYDWALNE